MTTRPHIREMLDGFVKDPSTHAQRIILEACRDDEERNAAWKVFGEHLTARPQEGDVDMLARAANDLVRTGEAKTVKIAVGMVTEGRGHLFRCVLNRAYHRRRNADL